MHPLIITAIVAIVVGVLLWFRRKKSLYTDKPKQPVTLPVIKPESSGEIPEAEIKQTPPDPAPGPQ